MHRNPYQIKNKKIGLIGFGSIGQRHYANMQKYRADVTVLSKRKGLNLRGVVKSWAEFMKRGPFEVIFITNETFKHISTLKKCLMLKPRAIFMEKPFSHNLKDLPYLAKLIKRRGISLWVGYNFHFFKPFIKIKEIVQSGKIGRLYYFRALIGQNLRTWRKRDYRENYSAHRQQGGGVLLDLVHDINYPAWILNDELIPKVALAKKISGLKIDAEDCADTIFVSKRRGVIVAVHQDYLRIPRKQALEIIGESGSLEWDSISDTITVQTDKKTTRQKIISERNEMFEDELRFFFNSVRGGSFFTNIDEAIRDMAVICHVKKYAKK